MKALGSSLETLPNTAFGIALGLCGNAILWRTAGDVRFTKIVTGRTPNWILWITGAVAWIGLVLALVVKIVKHRDFALCEWLHPTRCYFSFAPHLALTMWATATPKSLEEPLRPLKTAIFLVALPAQVILAILVYARWFFSPIDGDIGHASPPYLLSTVGWPLLCVLSQNLDLDRRWRFDIAALCFGPGTVWYTLAFISIVQTLHTKRATKGAPVLFLLIAPPSVMSVALSNFGLIGPSTAIFGFALFTGLVLIRLGPKLKERPSTLGVYWAYVFPLAALATAGLRFADVQDSNPAKILAWILLIVATLALVTVFCRMAIHLVHLTHGTAVWLDPLLNLSPEHHAAIINTFCSSEHPPPSEESQPPQTDDDLLQQRRHLAAVAKGDWAGAIVPTTSSPSDDSSRRRRRHRVSRTDATSASPPPGSGSIVGVEVPPSSSMSLSHPGGGDDLA